MASGRLSGSGVGTIRVLVAGQTPAACSETAALLERDARIEVVGRVTSAERAISGLRARGPHVVLVMDAALPGRDGLTGCEHFLAETGARVIAIRGPGEEALAARAVAAGALEVVPRPSGLQGVALAAWGARLAESVRLMAEVPIITARPRTTPNGSRPPRARVQSFGIVASTGGPPALAKVLGGLPRDLPASIVVAQHIAEGFAGGLTRWLAMATPLRVVPAEDGARSLPGHVYMAPDGHDVEVDEVGRLRTSPSPGGYRPSGNRLLGSLSRSPARPAGGIVLSGMGEDGAQGLLALRRAGGLTLAQEERSCVIASMPQAALRVGAVDRLDSLESIARTIIDHSAGP